MIDDDTTHYILDITQSHIVTLQGKDADFGNFTFIVFI